MDSWRGWPRRADARYSSAAGPRAARGWRSRSRPSSRANNPVRAQLSFAAVDRLHRSAEFLRLQRNGVRFQSPHFVLYAGNLDREPSRSRLGVTVSRRIGNAVVRNRVKRRVREIFRKELRARLPFKPLTNQRGAHVRERLTNPPSFADIRVQCGLQSVRTSRPKCLIK